MKAIKGLVWLLVLVVLAISSFPWVWLLITSFKPPELMFITPPALVFQPTLRNFVRVINEADLLHYLKNSLIIAIGSTILATLVGATGAYSMSRFNTGGKSLFFDVITLRMLPPIVAIIPYYFIMRALGLLNTYPAIILSHMIYALPFAVLLLKATFDETPLDLEGSALIDGCSRLGVFLRVTIPLAAPAIIAVTVFTFISSWNEFLFVLILGSLDTQTLPIMAAKESMGNFLYNWDKMAAIGTISVLPVLAFVYILQKYVVSGLTLGAIKG